MAAEPTNNNVSNWMFFLGILLLLMGVYGFARIAHVNIKKAPYPSAGVFPSTLLVSGANTYFGSRESDCEPYPKTYYESDGATLRMPKDEEKLANDSYDQALMKRCVNGFNEDRAKQEQRDKNQAFFLSFVGVGLIFTRRFVS